MNLVPHRMEPAQVPDRVVFKIVLTAAVVALGVWFTAASVNADRRYFIVDELAASGLATHEGEDLRVRGYVVAGSILHSSYDSMSHSFMLAYRGVAVRVNFHGALTDTFKDQSEVVVSGRLVKRHEAWIVDGDQLFTKCGGKYEGSPLRTSNSVKFQ